MSSSPGKFVISLDFELHWGVFDSQKLDHYRENLLGAREAVPRLLKLFEKYQIRCTWAIVGFLCCSDLAELLQRSPQLRPTYADPHVNSYQLIDKGIGQSERDDPFHYASSLVELIRLTAGQEVATHTFSHYYCQAQGQTREQFREDLRAAIEVLKKCGATPTSIVFPRNMCGHLDICQELGLKTFREEPTHWIYNPDPQATFILLRRLGKLLDSYVTLTGDNSWTVLRRVGSMANVRASRFLRPVPENSFLRNFEWLRFRRIKQSMKSAASKGSNYHLWWHPHNLGKRIEENLNGIEDLLSYFCELRSRYGFESSTMQDFA